MKANTPSSPNTNSIITPCISASEGLPSIAKPINRAIAKPKNSTIAEMVEV